MAHRLFLASFLLLATLIQASAGSREGCPVTRPQYPPFVPPPPYPPNPAWGAFWYGSDELWAQLNLDGAWHKGGEKLFLWQKGYDWRTEPKPDILVTERRLDLEVKALVFRGGTNAIMGRVSAMLTGTSIPTAGCWEITAEHQGHKLTFVVWTP